MTVDAILALEELDHRVGDGLEVTLLWNRSNGSVWLGLYDSREDTQQLLAVDPAKAMDAFEHPFAYASPVAVAAR